ncbi:5-deoxy-glucuronate isomerase [Vibrio sp. PP-XX7]
MYEPPQGESFTLEASGNERCLVLVSGHATIETPQQTFENIGDRMSPFEKKNPMRSTSHPMKR